MEFVRLVMVGLCGVAGWEVARSFGRDRPTLLLAGTVVGSGVGYVLGGAFGRRTASAVSDVERELRRVPAAEILAGAIWTLLGLTAATLLSVPAFHLPPPVAYPLVAATYLSLGYAGYSLGRAKSDDLFAMFGVKPRAAGVRVGEVSVLDASALLDGRLAALVRMGFLTGTVLVSRAVVDELQAVADSSNPSRRTRGRRALDRLVALKRDPALEVVVVEEEADRPDEPVDAQLLRLARSRGAALVTNDAALGKMASAMDIPVRSLHALAAALKMDVAPGDHVPVLLIRSGRDAGQAVGYLEDGTMIVVEGGQHLIGRRVTVGVTNCIQTSTGQLAFGRPLSSSGSESEA